MILMPACIVALHLSMQHNYQLNRGQVGGSHDLNVEPAWIQGLTGKGVTVAVVDDGKNII